MAGKDGTQAKPSCECPDCRREPGSALAEEHRAVKRLVAEVDERPWKKTPGRRRGLGGSPEGRDSRKPDLGAEVDPPLDAQAQPSLGPPGHSGRPRHRGPVVAGTGLLPANQPETPGGHARP